MKELTIFDNLFKLNKPRYATIDYVLNGIKEERCKKTVDEVRSEIDKSKRGEIKKKLPCVLFSGEFSNRSDDAFVKHSGFVCLDFDNFEDSQSLNQYRDYLISNKYTYAVFISPSGDGLKVIVKIPKSIEDHRLYFLGLKDYYNSKYFDTSCVNESRICYMSSDKDIFVNKDSELFTDKAKPKEIIKRDFKVEVQDNQKIISGLMKWWSERYGMVEGERNRNAYILAMAFNEFGISEFEAKGIMIQFAHHGFDEEEIKGCIESAYRKSHLFNTKTFSEDVKFDDYSPVSIQAEKKVNINFQNIYDSSFVDVRKKIEYPPVAISIGQHNLGSRVFPIPFGTYGNFSCIVGASKSKKTFLKSMIIASYIGGKTNQYADSIKSHRDRDCFVIDIDTEQSAFHAQNVFKRVLRMTGDTECEFYKPFALRPYEPKQRLEFIEWLIYESDMKDNIGLVGIDGLADLVDDFNDLKESQSAIQKIMKWTDDKQFHLTTILHSNYGSAKAVGHIGSSVLKKAETVCSVVNNDTHITAHFTHTRGFPIADFDYSVNDDGLPYIIGEYNDDVSPIYKPKTEIFIDPKDAFDDIPF